VQCEGAATNPEVELRRLDPTTVVTTTAATATATATLFRLVDVMLTDRLPEQMQIVYNLLQLLGVAPQLEQFCRRLGRLLAWQRDATCTMAKCRVPYVMRQYVMRHVSYHTKHALTPHVKPPNVIRQGHTSCSTKYDAPSSSKSKSA
jgi:hypothetical protein